MIDHPPTTDHATGEDDLDRARHRRPMLKDGTLTIAQVPDHVTVATATIADITPKDAA